MDLRVQDLTAFTSVLVSRREREVVIISYYERDGNTEVEGKIKTDRHR